MCWATKGFEPGSGRFLHEVAAEVLGPDVPLAVVTDGGETLGTMKDVMFTGANDVYVVERENGKELLLPAIKDCILDVDLENGVMTVHVLDGLLDL